MHIRTCSRVPIGGIADRGERVTFLEGGRHIGNISRVPVGHVQGGQIVTSVEGQVHARQTGGIPVADIQFGKGTVLEGAGQILNLAHIPLAHIQGNERHLGKAVTAGKHGHHVGYIGSVKFVYIQGRYFNEVPEHVIHVRGFAGIQQIQTIDGRNRSEVILLGTVSECVAGIRVGKNLAGTVAGNDQLRAFHVSHDTAVLGCGCVPRGGDGAGRSVAVLDLNLCNGGSLDCRAALGEPGAVWC